MAKKTAQRATAKAVSGLRFKFNFDAKDKSIRFELPELTNEPCMLIKVSNGNKDPTREFVTIKIHVMPILFQTSFWKAVCCKMVEKRKRPA